MTKCLSPATLLMTLALLALSRAAPAQSVLTYHNGNARLGDYVVPGLTASAAASMHIDSGFVASFTGNVHAQPLYWQTKADPTGEVIVVTESNTVLALNASTGATVWQTQLAPPAPLSAFPCGNINPEGITGTPVIDGSTGTLYLNALSQSGNNSPLQLIYAVSLKDGSVLPNWPINVQAALGDLGVGFSPLTQGQRSGALVLDKQVYFVYGGKFGDCGTYHGTVVQIDPMTAKAVASWETSANGGGIWSQGGISSDGKSLFTATGNTIGAQSWGGGEAIFRFKPGLVQSQSTRDYFVPTNWQSLDNADADLGGTEALPLQISADGKDDARILALGKDGNAYLVNGNNLGGISDPIEKTQVSHASIITGPAVYAGPQGSLVAFTNQSGLGNCSGTNLTMLSVAKKGKKSITQAWCAAFSGAGAPIVTTIDGSSDPLVWVVGAGGDNLLHGYDALTGAVVFSGGGATMTGLNHFQTLIAANSHLYVAANGKVYGFAF
jgi:outer membrane protein assembly factor BamB